ncbi:MAG TPA: hypothetical protein VFQ61_30305 [Polyangiaceae bacterium]|nr:hypothetical protein [Polyangiaceae bacterium]
MIGPLNALRAESAAATTSTSSGTNAATPRPEVLRAARDFEAIFLRTLLKPLENTTRLSTGGQSLPGQSAYGSMVVGALSDSLAASGGLGLAGVIARAMTASDPASALPPSAGQPGSPSSTSAEPSPDVTRSPRLASPGAPTNIEASSARSGLK